MGCPRSANTRVLATLLIATCAVSFGGCRGREGEGGTPSGSTTGTSAAPSSSSPTLAPSTVPLSVAGEVTQSIDPPPLAPRSRGASPRSRPFLTDTASDDGFETFRVVDPHGIAERIANLRLAEFGFGPPPRAEPNSGIKKSCAVGVVTDRVISGWCSLVTFAIPPPGSRAPYGPTGARVDPISLEFVDVEDAPTPITLASLFRPEVTDPQKLVHDACARGDATGDGGDDLKAPAKPGDKAPCTVDGFVLMPEALVLLWYSDNQFEIASGEGIHRARIPWTKLAAQLRKDGPACSFLWSAGDADEASTDAGTGSGDGGDPCR